MELTRASNHEQLAAYLKGKHPALATLLPADTSCADIFGEADADRPISTFFDATQDAAAGREFLRFTQMISLWLAEEQKKSTAKQRRDKRDAHLAATKAKTAAKKPKLAPPTPPTMALEDAQLVAEHAANMREESARERLLQMGYTAHIRVPGENASENQKFFINDPKKVCGQLGAVLRDESFGMYTIHFPGAALEAFEKAKRDVKSKTSGGKKGKPKVTTPMPYRNYKLPTTGDVITWQEFFGTLVATLYNNSDIVGFKLISNNSSTEIEAMGKAKVAEIEAKYKVKLDRLTSQIADADLKHEQAPLGPAKDGLAKQLQTTRGVRTALVAKQNDEVNTIELKYDGYKETKLIKEKAAAAKRTKASEATAALFARAAPAGGATSADGAAAIAAATAKAKKLGEPYETHEEVDAAKPISPPPNGPAPTARQIDEALRAAPDKWARLAATDIEASGVFDFAKVVVERAKELWDAHCGLPTEAEQAEATNGAAAFAQEVADL